MKQMTEQQWRQVIAYLLTNVNTSSIDGDRVQAALKDPEFAGRFRDFLGFYRREGSGLINDGASVRHHLSGDEFHVGDNFQKLFSAGICAIHSFRPKCNDDQLRWDTWFKDKVEPAGPKNNGIYRYLYLDNPLTGGTLTALKIIECFGDVMKSVTPLSLIYVMLLEQSKGQDGLLLNSGECNEFLVGQEIPPEGLLPSPFHSVDGDENKFKWMDHNTGKRYLARNLFISWNGREWIIYSRYLTHHTRQGGKGARFFSPYETLLIEK
jgi:hypothetical protein